MYIMYTFFIAEKMASLYRSNK